MRRTRDFGFSAEIVHRSDSGLTAPTGCGNLTDAHSRNDPRARRQQLPQFGIDSDGGVRQDRIYMAFPRIVDDIARVYVQFSGDRCTTWSEAKPIDASPPAHAEQFNQMVTVNRAGVVGVTWFDTRGSGRIRV